MGLMVEIVNVRSNPRFSTLECQMGSGCGWKADRNVTRLAVCEAYKEQKSVWLTTVRHRNMKKEQQTEARFDRTGAAEGGVRAAECSAPSGERLSV